MPPPAKMRLRITRQLYESIDGIQFPAFRPGFVYEVGSTIGNYLLATRSAEPVGDDVPYIVLSPETQLFRPVAPCIRTSRRNSPAREERAIAADWAPLRQHARKQVRLRAKTLEGRVTALAMKLARIKRYLEGTFNQQRKITQRAAV